MIDSGNPASSLVQGLKRFSSKQTMKRLRRIAQGQGGQGPLFPLEGEEDMVASVGECFLAEEVSELEDTRRLYSLSRADGGAVEAVHFYLRPKQRQALIARILAGWTELFESNDQELSCYLDNSIGSSTWYHGTLPHVYVEALLEAVERAYISGRIEALPKVQESSSCLRMVADLYGRMIHCLMKTAVGAGGARGVELARLVVRHAKASECPAANHRWYSNVGFWNHGPGVFMGGLAWAVYLGQPQIARLLLEEGAHPFGHHPESLTARGENWHSVPAAWASEIYYGKECRWWNAIKNGKPEAVTLSDEPRYGLSREEADLADVLFSLDIDEICASYTPDNPARDTIGRSWRADFTVRKDRWTRRGPDKDTQ